MKYDKLFQTIGKVYIVGACSRAKTLVGYLEFLYPHIHVENYLVDTLEGNEDNIKGVEVIQFNEKMQVCNTYPAFIATKGIYHAVITKQLTDLGFTQIIPITPEVDNFLKNEYVKRIFEKNARVFLKIEQLDCIQKYPTLKGYNDLEHTEYASSCIYMAKSIYDKPLQTEYLMPNYESAIQVGTSLTTQRLENCRFFDNEGDNISDKNRQYCELTGMYWIWKHASEDIVGLSHYRRHFILPGDWLRRMEYNGVDVILPVPTYVQPNIEKNYCERHDTDELECMLSYLKNQKKDDYQIAKKVFEGNLYYPCNMFIMKKDVLYSLCEWLFPILDAVTKECGIKEDVYLNRYPGFLSERLITVFFTKHSDKYRIAFADKTFIS